MKSKECLNENKFKIPLVVICSPTATGKTHLAIGLAESCDGEIINADSLQVYRHLDIGTAKPSQIERRRVTHHLIDIVNPDEEYNAAIYAQQARTVIERLFGEKKNTFVVGGTGLYIRALLQGMIDTPPVDKNIRKYYQDLRSQHGCNYLYDLLQKKDPEAARRINSHDAVRIIRALEVMEQSGISIISLQQKHQFANSPFETCKIGLRVERDDLKNRIRLRTEKMIEAGFVKEVQDLLDQGYSENIKPLQSLGYRQIIGYLRGCCDWNRTIDCINRETWHYSKRQSTWFSADKTIKWFSPGQEDEIREFIDLFQNKFLHS